MRQFCFSIFTDGRRSRLQILVHILKIKFPVLALDVMPSGTVVIAHGPAPASLTRMGLRFALSHAAVRQYVQPVQRKGRAAGHQAVPCALRIGPEVSLRTSHIYPSRCDAGQQQVLVHRQGGGVCNGISEVRELFETDQNGFGTGGQVSVMQLLVWCAIVVWYGAKLLERERMRQKHPIWKVSFFWKTKFFSGSALMDSGNSLKDPYTGRPVCILDEETAKKLGISTEKAVRLIPYHSIGRDHGLLRAVTVSELYLRKDGQEKKIADVTVAVGPGRLSRSGGYQMILHPALLEEKKGADHDIKSSDAGKSAV